MATYSITLTPFRANAYAHRRNTTRLRVIASAGVNVPEEIFVHKESPLDPYTQETTEEFVHIAKIYDLNLYPRNAPATAPNSPPFYRKAIIDIQLPDNVEADEVLQKIYTQVQELLNELAALENLEEEDAVTFSAVGGA